MLGYIPIIGRLRASDYIRVFVAVVLLVTEPILRCTAFVISPLVWTICTFMRLGSNFNRNSPPSQTNPRTASKHSLHSKGPHAIPYPACGCSPEDLDYNERLDLLYRMQTTEDLIKFWKFPFQEHYFTTHDGYIIALHRIPFSRNDYKEAQDVQAKERKTAAKSDSTDFISSFITSGNVATKVSQKSRPVVLLWHGFMMCSEVWVCHTDINLSLAFSLADAGYDVWLGNTRGNKYSCKHRKYKTTEEGFWNFSMDHLALYDLPDAVDYILNVTEQPSLTYIGFSQGTAQGFSSLAINPQLNKKINLFIALAPAAKPKGLTNSLVASIIGLSPEIIYLLFGKKSLMPSALFWHSILDKKSYAFSISTAVRLLFRWTTENIKDPQVVFNHLYSYTSVKCVVHWFQIINRGRFQMYDETPGYLPNGQNSGHLVPKFPTQDIQTPIALFYGGMDTLADMKWLLKETASPIYCLQVEEYEHICFLWAKGLDRTVIPAVLGLLDKFAETWDYKLQSPQTQLSISSFDGKLLSSDSIDSNELNGPVEFHIDDIRSASTISGHINEELSHPMEPTNIEEPASRDSHSNSVQKPKKRTTFVDEQSESDLHNGQLTEYKSVNHNEHPRVRTIPHISERQIKKMLALGMPKVVDDGRSLEFDGVVSFRMLTDKALNHHYINTNKKFVDVIDQVMDQIRTRKTSNPLKTLSGKGGGRLHHNLPHSWHSHHSFDGVILEEHPQNRHKHSNEYHSKPNRRRSVAGHEFTETDSVQSTDIEDEGVGLKEPQRSGSKHYTSKSDLTTNEPVEKESILGSKRVFRKNLNRQRTFT